MATLVANKKVRRDFTVLEELDAGVELFGHEVKSLRNSKASLSGSHAVIRGNEAFLVGATIAPYQQGNTPDDYDQSRPRRLLLTKKEIAHLAGVEQQKGLTIVPIKVYTRGRFVKVQLAIVRGKKKHDKRQSLKERDDKRHIQRTLKSHIR